MFWRNRTSDKTILKKSKFWNAQWYKKTYLSNSNLDPLEHFLHYGWKRGYRPSKEFNSQGYLDFYDDVKASGLNPLLHYERFGKYEHRFTDNFEYSTIKSSIFFDEKWYQDTYQIAGDCVQHYLDAGWKLGYNPSSRFSTLSYLALNYDVRKNGDNPLLHYERYGRHENTRRIFEDHILPGLDKLALEKCYAIQNQRIKEQYKKDIKKLILFLVPEIDDICGGLMSICSIARVSKDFKDIHDSEVLIATVPSVNTFSNYTRFDAGFDIFRFEQIFEHFTSLESLMIHIPENFVIPFVIKVSVNDIIKLQKVKNLQINILNQNMLLMPRPGDIEDFLRKICSNLSMTVAHLKYCTPQMRTSYNMPVHLFSASNLTEYFYTPYKEKENLLVYSPDDNPCKNQILHKIKAAFPDLTLLEIRNMSYLQYRKVISRAKWMITFGEGLDGYFVESIRSGAIAFACYNNVFFNEKFSGSPNIYSSISDMLNNICSDMQELDHESVYKELNDTLRAIDAEEYDDSKYIDNIRQFYLEIHTFPLQDIQKKRNTLLSDSPKISIAMATYNGEKYLAKQLLSLVHLDYPNYEIVISDDGSSDRTVEIVKHFQKYYPISLYENTGKHGLNENFANAISHTTGEYVALCDQDDIWHPQKLKILLSKIDTFDIVFGNVTVIDENDCYHPYDIMHDAYEYSKHRYYQFTDYIYENLMLGCTSLIRKEFLESCLPIPEKVIYHDWWIVLNAIKRGNGLCYVDKPVIYYRQHSNNTAKSTFEKLDWYQRKAEFDRTILSQFDSILTEAERKYIQSDYYWNQLRNILRFNAPNYSDEFFDSNRNSFSQKTFNEILSIANLEVTQ